MFWADKIVDDIEERLKGKIAAGEIIVVRDEKTVSGRMLVSAMRGAAIHGIISEILSDKEITNEFLWEINDTDAFRSIPKNLDEAKYKEYFGFPLYKIPSPEEGFENYPEYFASEFTEVMEHLKFTPKYYRSSEAYNEGKFNDSIKVALERAKDIREIYRKISGSEKPEDWLPVMMVCEKCGKIATTKAISFDGEKVKYECNSNEVEWADGCGHSGESSPFNGGATLPWKVEWAAKFKIFNVSVEGGGKDLSTKGGARDVSNHIAKEIFEYNPPIDIPYEFFLADGKKMSTSKGNAPAARDVMNVLPPLIYRLVFLGKKYNQAIEFNIKGDTIPTLFDRYDHVAEKFWSDEGDDDARLFHLLHKGEIPKEMFLPRFSLVAFIVQMPHLDVYEEFEKDKGSALTDDEKAEIDERVIYAKKWIDTYAPERFKYELQIESVPEAAQNLPSEVKALLMEVVQYIEANEKLDGGELHHEIHRIRKASTVEPAEFFSAIYQSFLGKESGPKAGWFLSVLERDFLISRLREVSV